MEVQASGGMPLLEMAENDEQIMLDSEIVEKKVKTAGGVFLTLMKKHPKFTKDMKKRVFRAEKERRKENKKTTRLVGAISLNRGIPITIEDIDSNKIIQKQTAQIEEDVT